MAIAPPKPGESNVPKTVIEGMYVLYVGERSIDYFDVVAKLSFPKTMDHVAVSCMPFGAYAANVTESKAVFTWDCHDCKLTLTFTHLNVLEYIFDYRTLANKYVGELLKKIK